MSFLITENNDYIITEQNDRIIVSSASLNISYEVEPSNPRWRTRPSQSRWEAQANDDF